MAEFSYRDLIEIAIRVLPVGADSELALTLSLELDGGAA